MSDKELFIKNEEKEPSTPVLTTVHTHTHTLGQFEFAKFHLHARWLQNDFCGLKIKGVRFGSV